MLVRHVVELNNVTEDMRVKDPTLAYHALIKDGALLDIAGRIDPTTHLNVGYPHHRMVTCAVVQKCDKGGRVLFGPSGLLFARVEPRDFKSLGPVDLTQRRVDMLKAFHELRRRMESRKV